MKERTMKTTFYKTALAGGFALSLATASSALLAQGMPQSGPHGGQMQGQMHGQMHGGAGADKRMSPNAERFLKLYDLNGDGKVTVEEINADQARMFGALDIDSDKALSVAEMQRRGRSLQLWRTVTMFDLLDLNGDGKISVEELQGPTKRWFARHDLNKNGILEEEELPSPRWGRGRGRR
jgi:hypothetical protein